MTVFDEIDGKSMSHVAETDHAYMSRDKFARPVAKRILSSLSSVAGAAVTRAIGSTESERTPWAPWINTPSMSAVAEGPV